jgi:hypothetical protein
LTRRAAAALALALAGPASAQDTGTLVRGDVVRSATDGTPPQLVVRLDDGAEVEVNLGTAARAVFAPGLWTFDTPPLLADVRPGMRVELLWDPQRVDRVRVLGIPPGTRAGVPVEAPAEGWGGAAAPSGPGPGPEEPPGALRRAGARGARGGDGRGGREPLSLADGRARPGAGPAPRGPYPPRGRDGYGRQAGGRDEGVLTG